MTGEKKSGGFAFRVKAAAVPSSGLDLIVEADDAERAAIAERLEIEGLDRFRIEASVSQWHRRGLRVSGTLYATVEQRCVVTLDPVHNDIEERFEATFEPVAKVRRAASGKEVAFDALETEEPPEPMVDGSADIGALAIEHLALAIDPYPRKPGVDLEREMPSEADPGEETGAFDILRKLK